MPKPVSLTPDALIPSIAGSPAAATAPRAPKANKPALAVKTMPLQIRLPREEVKAIKVAAAQSEQTISDFMLACFHAHMKATKHA
jgi:hypothetical protein